MNTYLSTGVGVRILETDGLGAEEVLATRDARGNGESRVSLVQEEAVGGPLVGLGVVAILPDLEPFEARDGGLRGIGDSGPTQSEVKYHIRNMSIILEAQETYR